MCTRFAFSLALASASALALGCGGGDGPENSECGFGAGFLPYDLGYTWTYNSTDLTSGIRTTKSQTLSSALVTSADFPGDMFIEQTTTKATGRTVSLVRVVGDDVIRFRQEDFDDLGVSERVTIYDPGKLRISGSAERTAMGASFEETYTATVTDSMGSVPTAISETWLVVSDNESCASPFGTFECIHLRVTRTAGGAAAKDFWFADGIGKIREEGDSQLEELTACAAP